MTKRDILLAICENPGWHPPATENGSRTHTLLAALNEEGWILPRLDGYEATPKALTEYPVFPTQEDLIDPDAAPEAPRLSSATGDWYDLRCPDTMTMVTGQRMDMAIEQAFLVRGGITLEAIQSRRTRVEIEIILRVRERPIDDRESE